MVNRRQFLGGGISGSALFSAFSARAGALLTDPAPKALSGFVFDERFAQATLLARSLRPLGVEAFGIQSDVSEVWYERLAPGLEAGVHVIGGLTTAGGLFMLTRLGFDAGLALAMQGRHRLVDDGSEALHALDASPFIERRFNAALESGLSWTSALRAVLPEVAVRPPADHLTLSNRGALDTARQTVLHSWVMMPRS